MKLILIIVYTIYLLFNTQAAEASSETICDLSTWTAPEPLGLENWIDHAADGFAGGSGTREDPFLISTAEQLAYLAKLVNEGSFDERINIEILNDIDLAGKEWTPIGTKQHHFIGTFNGGNNVISNLTIATSQDGQGLFGFAVRSSLINLTLTNVNIKGRDFVGGLAGAIGGSNISLVNLTGTVEGRRLVGGFSGYGVMNWSSQVTYLGSVKGDAHVGGFTGELSNIDRLRVFNAPLIIWPTPAPGDFNLISSRIPEPYVSSYSVTASVSGRKYVGGVVGSSEGGVVISRGIFAGAVKGEAFSGGIRGFPSMLSGTNMVVLLYAMGDDIEHPEPPEVAFRGVRGIIPPPPNTVLRHKNNTWYLNSNPLPVEDAENNFLSDLRLGDYFANYLSEYITGRTLSSILMLWYPRPRRWPRCLWESRERQLPPFHILDVPYGIEIPQGEPLSIYIGGEGFSPVLSSFTDGEFWVEGNFFKMSGVMRDIPKGVYVIPCFRSVDGNFETALVLLNVD